MSRWIGSVTPGSINLTRVSSGSVLVPLLVLLIIGGGVSAAVSAIVASAAVINLVLTVVFGVAAAVAVLIPAVRVVREVVADRAADRVEAAWRAQVDQDRQAWLDQPAPRALEAAPVVRVESYVVDPEREREPVDLDALGGGR